MEKILKILVEGANEQKNYALEKENFVSEPDQEFYDF